MSFANSFVSTVLRSPLHRVLSGSTDLIRYRGRRTGREIMLPTQYAERGSEVVILVARPETKTWWRNFCTERELDLLIRGRWSTMTASAVVGADDPVGIGPLLDAYLQRFPHATRALGGGTPDERARRAVVVRCRRY